MAAPVLLSDPEKVDQVYPFLPVMSVNTASVVAEIAAEKAKEIKLGLVLRPCELRAVVELVKLQQIARENLVLIGVDCPGTYQPAIFNEQIRGDGSRVEPWVDNFIKGQENYLNDDRMRHACRMCEFPTPLVYDLAIGFLGLNPKEQLLLESANDSGEGLLAGRELTVLDEIPLDRQRYRERLVQMKKERAEQEIARFDRIGLGPENLVRYFANCINCHNCMKVCPICYCRECFFDSEALKRDLEGYVRTSKRKGINRMPAGTLLFHLTRMNHMMTSCVQCGVCEDSCPAGVGLSVLFKKVSRNAQAAFDYLSGRSWEEPLPLTTFKEDEFCQVGE